MSERYQIVMINIIIKSSNRNRTYLAYTVEDWYSHQIANSYCSYSFVNVEHFF